MKIKGRLIVKKYTGEGMICEIKADNMACHGRVVVPGINPEDSYKDADFEIVLEKEGGDSKPAKAKKK